MLTAGRRKTQNLAARVRIKSGIRPHEQGYKMDIVGIHGAILQNYQLDKILEICLIDKL